MIWSLIPNRVDVEDWLPVFAQNVEAHVPLEVNVRVVNSSVAQHLFHAISVRMHK